MHSETFDTVVEDRAHIPETNNKPFLILKKTLMRSVPVGEVIDFLVAIEVENLPFS